MKETGGERDRKRERESETKGAGKGMEQARSRQPLWLNQSGLSDALVTRISIIHDEQTETAEGIGSRLLHGPAIKNKSTNSDHGNWTEKRNKNPRNSEKKIRTRQRRQPSKSQSRFEIHISRVGRESTIFCLIYVDFTRIKGPAQSADDSLSLALSFPSVCPSVFVS